MRGLPLALAVSALLAGCLGQGGIAAPPDHAFAGTFAATATPEEIELLSARVRAEGGDVATQQTLPVEFVASALTQKACQGLRDHAALQTYVTRLDACAPIASPSPQALADGASDDDRVGASAPVAQRW